MDRIAVILGFFVCSCGMVMSGQLPDLSAIADREINRQQEQDRVRLQQAREAQSGIQTHVAQPSAVVNNGQSVILDVDGAVLPNYETGCQVIVVPVEGAKTSFPLPESEP